MGAAVGGAIGDTSTAMLPLPMQAHVISEVGPTADQPENRVKPVPLPALRRSNGTFAPGGPSANPGGRPRVIADVQALAREHTQEAVATLVAIMRDPDAPAAARGGAANAILDRGWGKPPVAVLINDNREEEHRQARILADYARIREDVAIKLAECRRNYIESVRPESEAVDPNDGRDAPRTDSGEY